MIKILVVDDSPVMRRIIRKILTSNAHFEVKCAADPYAARQLIKSFSPHVLTLDIEMPKMDGVTFLRNLMKLNPLPVVMLSTLTNKGADATLIAMELGAIDFIGKPKADSTDLCLQLFAESLVEKVKIAAASFTIVKSNRTRSLAYVIPPKQTINANFIEGKLIAIGASTGGIEAIKYILTDLSTQLPPIIITQHLPEMFSKKFAERLNNSVNVNVKHAVQGELLSPGCVYIANAGLHLKVKAQRGQLICVLDDSPKVNQHRPSVDVMFESLLLLPAKQLLLILLTGMGKDGAFGMKKLADKGAYCIVQDRETSVVWGMPARAVDFNCVDKILPISEIAEQIEGHYSELISR